MKVMRVYLVFWLSGMIAGVILMERWRRHGGRYVPVEPGMAGPLDVSPEPSSASAPAKKPNVVGLVVAGAKLDAERVKQRVAQAKRPGTVTDAPADSTTDSAVSGAQ